ncbi:HD domain-containing protein [bacterium]|nr:HD domain-containing protein [bacterium]
MKEWNPTESNRFLMGVALVFLAFLLNFIPSKIALALNLPVFLDSIGTVVAGMIGGNLPAVIAGFCGNAVNGISDITTFYYGIISIMIGVAAAVFQRNGFFKKWYGILAAIVVFSILGGGIGSVLTYFLYGYDFGEGISAPFAVAIYEYLGFSKFFSQLLADIIIDVFDKAVVVGCSLSVYRAIPEASRTRAEQLFLFFPDFDGKYKKALYHANIKRSLLKKVIVMVIIAEILLGTVATITGFFLYRQVAISKFTEIADGVTKAASVVIDKDKIEEFLEKGRVAEGYAEIEKNLYKIKESFPQTMYLYVYKIMEDGCHVVFDLDSEGGADASQPGEIMEFDTTFVPYLQKLLKGEEIEPIISDGQFGQLLTVYKPLTGSTYVAADITIASIVADEAKFIIKLISIFFGLSIIIMSIVLELVNRGIVNPVNRMAYASMKFAYNLNHQDSGKSGLEMLRSLDIRTFDEIENLYHALSKMGTDSINHINQLNRQNERIMKMQEEIIINFAEMVEARDNSTGNHIKKTAFYVEAIAKELQKEGAFKDVLTDTYIRILKRSAPLHDIGKIAISDIILNKPGKLTDEEFKIMQSHTTEGKNILMKIEATASDMDKNYLKESIEMAYYHHEKWDGTGYPCGIKGEEIPVSARIMAVADVFDALVAERIYKKAFSYEKAMAIITEGSGKAFDPVVVEAFMHISKELYDERTVLGHDGES